MRYTNVIITVSLCVSKAGPENVLGHTPVSRKVGSCRLEKNILWKMEYKSCWKSSERRESDNYFQTVTDYNKTSFLSVCW